MNECETDLIFKLSGRVFGKTSAAIETIKVLNLGDTEKNNKSLIEKQLCLFLLIEQGINPQDQEALAEETELLQEVIDDLLSPVDGKLKSFAPVVANVLIILHELCHIAEHNHSANFYRLLTSVMPHWREMKNRLDGMTELYLND